MSWNCRQHAIGVRFSKSGDGGGEQNPRILHLVSKFGGNSGGEEKLEIRSGEEISESGAQTYDIEYKLTDKWGLVGQYDRFNAFNVSIKRRIFSR